MSTWRYLTAHLDALGAHTWDLGVLTPRDTMIRRLDVSRDVMLHAVPWLRAQNVRGSQIFFRPSVAAITAILVDDIPRSRLSHLPLRPSVVVETSPGNTQCWIRLTHPVSVDEARLLARTWQQAWQGDPSSADGQHFGRWAGFTNRWPRHRAPDGTYPLVRLLAITPTVIDPESILTTVSESFAVNEQFSKRRGHPGAEYPAFSPSRPTPINRGPTRLRDLADFWADPRYGGDLHRADSAWALAALRQGWSPQRIAATLQAARDLTKKGSARRQQAYVARTVAKAQQWLAQSS